MDLQAYVCKLAQHLLDIQGSCDHPALAQVQQCSIELRALFLCFCAGRHQAKADFLAFNMDAGAMHEGPVPDEDCSDLLVRYACCMQQQRCECLAP